MIGNGLPPPPPYKCGRKISQNYFDVKYEMWKMGLLPPHRIMHSYFCHCHTVRATGPIPLAMQALGEFSFHLGNPDLWGYPLSNKCK
jgi:hypothetical protein